MVAYKTTIQEHPMKRSIGLIVLSAALAGSAGAALAQQGTHDQRQPRAFSKPTERVEARLAYVRTALKITDAQAPQWNAYAESMRKQAAEGEKRMQEWRAKRGEMHKDQAQKSDERQRPSAIERLDRQQKMLAAASARVNARIAAVKPLYESLNPEQKKVADVVLVEGRGRG